MTEPLEYLGPQTVTLRQATVILGTNWKHAYELVREGRFPVRTVRVGKRILVPRRAIDRYLEGADESSGGVPENVA